MKKLGLLCVVVALFLSGCGKKKNTNDKSFKKTSGKLLKAQSEVPVFEETENFFDGNKVADFAFIDEETMELEANEVLPTDSYEVAEFDRVNNEATLTTAALNELVASVDELERDMMSEAIELGDADSIVFKTVHFDLNKNELRADQKSVLEEDIKLAQQAVEEGKDVVVQGHCCQLGPDSYNLALSQRRAEAIKKEMVSRGVDAKHVKTIGCGNEMPVVWSDAKDKKALINELAPNRRAEILVN